jgi:lipopolysaccharide biosynthesis protein
MANLSVEQYWELLDEAPVPSETTLDQQALDQAIKLKANTPKAPFSIRLRRKFFWVIGQLTQRLSSSNHWISWGDVPRLELDTANSVAAPSFDIGVHLHVYYPELLPEMMVALQYIGQPFTCYLTTNSEATASRAEILLNHHPWVKTHRVIVTENRGRDIGPWIVGMAGFNDDHELWCHIHTKKSPHAPDIGNQWRQFLLTQLLGSEATVGCILSAFDQDPDLGLVIPAFYDDAISRGMNDWDSRDRAHEFFTSLGLGMEPPRNPVFSAGSMCWYRPGALQKLFRHGYEYADFEEEAGQIGMTLMHLVERSLVYVALSEELGYRVVVPARD